MTDLSLFDPNSAGNPNNNIFGLPFSEEDARLVILPIPWEVTVSYNAGTARAPAPGASGAASAAATPPPRASARRGSTRRRRASDHRPTQMRPAAPSASAANSRVPACPADLFNNGVFCHGFTSRSSKGVQITGGS